MAGRPSSLPCRRGSPIVASRWSLPANAEAIRSKRRAILVSRHWSSTSVAVFRRPDLAIRIGRAIQKLKPSVLHAHGARAGLPAALIPGMLRCPFVYTVHGFHYVSKPIGVRALARQAERFCMNKAGATVFVSDFDRGLASDDVMPDRSSHVVIHNGAATAEGGVEPRST